MIKLKVTPEEALEKLNTISHQKCRNAIRKHWFVDANDQVRARSVCWLFCWAKTGLNSPDAAKEAQNVFNAILDITYDDFNKRVPHKWALEARYSPDDIEDELSAFLKGDDPLSKSV